MKVDGDRGYQTCLMHLHMTYLKECKLFETNFSLFLTEDYYMTFWHAVAVYATFFVHFSFFVAFWILTAPLRNNLQFYNIIIIIIFNIILLLLLYSNILQYYSMKKTFR